MIEYKPTRNIAHAMCFESFVALEGREDGLTRLWLLERGKDGALCPSMNVVDECRLDMSLFWHGLSQPRRRCVRS